MMDYSILPTVVLLEMREHWRSELRYWVRNDDRMTQDDHIAKLKLVAIARELEKRGDML